LHNKGPGWFAPVISSEKAMEGMDGKADRKRDRNTGIWNAPK
jgi:hypothetical protein